MQKFLFILLSLFFCFTVQAEEQELQFVAVLEFEGVDIPSQTLRSTTEAVREGALDMLPPDRFKLMTKASTLAILNDMGIDASCIEGNCEVETLRNIQADYGVTGTIQMIDGQYQLVLQLYEAKSASVLDIKREAFDTLRTLQDGAKHNAKLLIANIPGAGLGSSVSLANVAVRRTEIYKGEDIINAPTDKSGFLFIESEPDGATIKINGEAVGVAPVQRSLPEGKYVVTADMGAIYHPATSNLIELKDGQTVNIPLVLKPSYGYLSINSEPKGAKIYISGQYIGDTPYENKRQPSNVYNLRIEKDKHFSYLERIVIEDEEKTYINPTLDRSLSSLIIESTPSKADIWLNGTPTGEQTPFTFRDKAPGAYEIRLLKNKYKPYDGTVQLKAGDSLNYKQNLKTNFGYIEVTSIPKYAKISLNGVDTGRKTPTTFEKVTAGVTLIELHKDGYGIERDRIEVPDDGSTFKLEKTLTPKLATLILTSTDPLGKPCSGNIYVNEEHIGTTPFKTQLVAIEQKIIVDCNGMKGIKTIHLKHNESITLDIKVQNFTYQDIRRMKRTVKRSYLLDIGLIALSGISTNGIATNYLDMQNSLSTAAAISDPNAGSEYNTLLEDVQNYKLQTNINIAVSTISTMALVTHYIVKTKRNHRSLREMEKIKRESS